MPATQPARPPRPPCPQDFAKLAPPFQKAIDDFEEDCAWPRWGGLPQGGSVRVPAQASTTCSCARKPTAVLRLPAGPAPAAAVDGRVPAMERAYTAAAEAGDKDKAARLLAKFTADAVGRAQAMLDAQLEAAAQALGMNEVPDDAELSAMIEEATAAYGLHGPHLETQGI